MKKFFIFVLVTLCLFFAMPALSQTRGESVKSFDSQITVNPDSSMIVTETIVVHSEDINIVHGIYRDFPTKYKDGAGNNYNVGFDLLSVKRDGKDATYDTENLSNGIRIYIRDKNIILPPGDYAFEITYKTTGQLGFFSDHDELYWNVTGNGWSFMIEKASAEVTLPEGISLDRVKLDGYTGSQGARDKYFSTKTVDGKIIFTSAAPLLRNNGLTIVVGWPKGFVQEPTAQEKQAQFIRDNTGLAIMCLGVIIIILYYFIFWLIRGRDPKKGTIIPIYEPPLGLLPASMGYLKRMGFGNELLVAQIINMAVKGYIKISKDSLHYKLTKSIDNNDLESLPDEDKLIIENLFDGRGSIEIKQSHHEEIADTIQELSSYLKVNFGKYFSTNLVFVIFGIILSLVVFGAGSFFFRPAMTPVVLFLGFWLTMWTLGVASMLYRIYVSWKGVIGGNKQPMLLGAAITITLFSIPFIIAEVVVAVIFSGMIGFIPIAALIIMAAVNGVFIFFMKAPTIEGRKMMDEIDGFKWFLSVTEKDRMEFFNPPEKTPELFEKYLPYALALGVENRWSQQFTQVFNRLHDEGHDYNPVWYSGAGLAGFTAGTFASSLSSSMSASIASSSSAPGSSSGFGGGGGSGGGGGGGGGGGC